MFFGERKKQYTQLQLAFMDALRDPENRGKLRDCMNIAGYTKSAPITEVVKSLKKEIIDIAEELLASAAPEASCSIASALGDEGSITPGVKEKLAAANSILDRTGISKTERLQVDSAPNRVFIVPARRPSE